MKNYTYKGSGGTRLWWMPLITGLLAIAIGIWCLFDPSQSLPVLAYFFGGCILGCGVLNLLFALSNTSVIGWGWPFAIGVLELLCGIWIFCLPPQVAVTVFIYSVAIYLIVIAVNSIAESCMLSSLSSFWTGWLVALLLLTLFFAILFLIGPVAGGIAVWIYIGVSFICFGIYRICYAFNVKKINRVIRF